MIVTTVTKPDEQSPALRRGRLMFAIDATASRAPTWAIARGLQAKMFREAAPVGQLQVQLVFYRGTECKASKWVDSGERLAQLMNRIECQSGFTQIGRVLKHALNEIEIEPVQALTFIGDACEIANDGPLGGVDQVEVLAAMARQLGARGTPIYLFQEGRDPDVRSCSRCWR
jgi:hypothetical protein